MTTGADTRRAARNAGALAAASLFSKGMLFVWQFVLARWLGDAGFGIYGTVGALATIATVVGSFGMGLIVVRDVSREPDKAGAYLTATLFLQTGLVIVAFLLMNAAAAGLGYSSAIRVYTAISGIGLIVDLFGNMSSDQLLAQERMVTTSIVEAVHIVLRIALVALALWAGFGLLGLYGAGILAGAARSVIFWRALARTGVRPVFPLDRDIAAALFVNSAPLAASAVLLLAYQQADKLMSTTFLDETRTGYLTAVFVIISGVIELLSTTVLVATYPLMSRYYESHREMFGFIVEKLVFFTTVVTLPICLVLSVFAPDVAVPLFGERFRPMAEVLRVLIWYALVAMAVNVFAQGMMVQNRQRWLLVIRASGLTLNLALNITLLTVFNAGLLGLAYASVTAEVFILAVMLVTFHDVGIHTGRLARHLLRPLAVGALAAAVMLLAGWAHVLAGMVAGVGVYAALVILGGVLAADDWDLVYRLVAAMPGGALVLRYWQRDVAINW